jgi:hypothetical protein
MLMGLEKTVKTLESITQLINNLSNDDDVRQDLWLSYLSDGYNDEFEICLKNIKLEHLEDIAFKEAILQLIHNPPNDQLSNLIEQSFTAYERSIICCLMLGLDAAKISEIKGISEVRIKQSIAIIRYNNVWKEFYGIKEKLNK